MYVLLPQETFNIHKKMGKWSPQKCGSNILSKQVAVVEPSREQTSTRALALKLPQTLSCEKSVIRYSVEKVVKKHVVHGCS